MFRFSLFVITIGFLFASCNNNSINPEDIKQSKYKEPLIRVNKQLVDKDIDRIRNFAKRRNWNLQESKTGFYYDIYEKTNNDSIKHGDVVSFNYTLSLLDGTLCYTSDSLGSKSFILGQGGVESGLEQGIQLMKRGEKARFILPPHLAHGLLGDDNKIPPRAIIVYQIELLNE